ncbi:hypothetical protein SULAZ_1358 [Sulfurihydrogenibium azorense Az-Fu1]|uniref:Uncharacterized protein n=1 Tax=Sulfurihydrogenibium azorense (strain DSM 15241 / OCM 825 / Az-Fu1) TaxID=204536 RepID=C1DW38_SULAA|nr:hypothetical protein [Sulfurihydrogenibium azorense]ACN98128.1 hypothetical protein SULAZ_1358 [Sulfurihydrogenibium azorense Az-Fu1]
MVFLRTIFIVALFIISFSKAQVLVKPGEITYLEVKYSDTIIAGEPQNIEFKATDAFGNSSNNLGLSDKIKVVSNGLILDKLEIYPTEIKNGVFTLKVNGRKVGDYSIQFLLNEKPIIIKVQPTNALTPTLRFKVINNRADFVIITSPDTFLPGYPYTVKASFYDKEGNPIITKYHLNQSFVITANGNSKEVNINDFIGETYEYQIIPYLTKEFSIEVIDKSTNKKVASKVVQPEKQEIGKIDIEMPLDIEVGKPFKIKLKAYDTKGKLIKVYDKIGRDVILKTSGSGDLIPNKVPKEAFSDGVAEVDVIYTKSETISIYPEIEGSSKPVEAEKPQKEIKQEKKQEVKETPKSKEKTSIKLKFPSEVGTIGRLVELSTTEKGVSLKVIFSKRDLDYEIKKYEKEITINNKTVGKIVFFEEPDHNVKIDVLVDTKQYNVKYQLLPKNSVEVEIEEK